MAVPSTGPFYILLAGRGTGQTATVYAGKPTVSDTGASTDLMGPYTLMTQVAQKLQQLTITGAVNVVNPAGTVLGSVDPTTGQTSPTSNANPGSSEPSNPAGAVKAEGGVLGAFPSVTDPLDYLADVGDFFHRLTEASFWERCGEVLIGVIILYIGVKSLSEGTAVGNTASGVKKKTSGILKKAAETAVIAG
jgi:hypothetical protein